MSEIPAALRDEVVRRAGDRCESCGLAQVGQEAAFHVDHVVPRVAGGPTELDNLALACVSCSLRKWARESATDPPTGAEVPLFNPRRQRWGDHFRWEGAVVVPLGCFVEGPHPAASRPPSPGGRGKEFALSRGRGNEFALSRGRGWPKAG